ncbi:MAG: 30S ribosomal protein S13 [Nanoarchaeota archaeon]|nr:30S ribosomal protein S13 [Nanoarchaeota archaeon]
MPEQTQTPETKPEAPQEIKQKPKEEKQKIREIVRILNTDIPGNAKIYYGLTRIKGISWNLSNTICYILKLDKNQKVGTFTDAEIKKIEDILKNIANYDIPSFILNKPKTQEGKHQHLVGTDLELQLKADIRDMREIQSYRGIRHALGLPVRGQRTKAHFRHGRTLGVVKKKTKQKVGTKKG